MFSASGFGILGAAGAQQTGIHCNAGAAVLGRWLRGHKAAPPPPARQCCGHNLRPCKFAPISKGELLTCCIEAKAKSFFNPGHYHQGGLITKVMPCKTFNIATTIQLLNYINFFDSTKRNAHYLYGATKNHQSVFVTMLQSAVKFSHRACL